MLYFDLLLAYATPESRATLVLLLQTLFRTLVVLRAVLVDISHARNLVLYTHICRGSLTTDVW
jgi:hypothetical protein